MIQSRAMDYAPRFAAMPSGVVGHWRVVDMVYGERDAMSLLPTMTHEQIVRYAAQALNELDQQYRKKMEGTSDMGKMVDAELLLQQLEIERNKIDAAIEYLRKFIANPAASPDYKAKVAAARESAFPGATAFDAAVKANRGVSPAPKPKGRNWTPEMREAMSARLKQTWAKKKGKKKAAKK